MRGVTSRTYERVVASTGQPDFSIPMKKRLAEEGSGSKLSE